MKFSTCVEKLSKRLRKIVRTENFRHIIVACIVLAIVVCCTKDVKSYEAESGLIIQNNIVTLSNKNQEVAYWNCMEFEESAVVTTTKQVQITTTISVTTTQTATTQTTTQTTPLLTTVTEETSTAINTQVVTEYEAQDAIPTAAEFTQQQNTVSINATIDSWSDYELLAHLINAESGNCTQEEMLWVGQVVLNRVESQYFPNSIREVIFQNGQYSTTWGGQIYCQPKQECYDAANLLLQGNRYIPANVLFQTNGRLRYTLYAVTGHNLKFYTYGG